MKNISAYILGIVALFATMACSKEAEDTIVTIDREVNTYFYGPLDFTVGPDCWSTNLRIYNDDTCKLQFKSNDENVVLVNEDGLVKGVNPGKTTIDITTINGAPVLSYNIEVPPYGVSTRDNYKVIETKEIKSAARFNGSFLIYPFCRTSEIILLSTEENKDWSSITNIEKYYADADKGEYMIYKFTIEGTETDDGKKYCSWIGDWIPLPDEKDINPIQVENGIYTIFAQGDYYSGPAIFYRGEIKQIN